ncbi:guanine deaminase [Bradysia coprophila]|uniref:guanine deaminase n=1 Tax=Bradysia coprophila TaxID=38358 RepID=UPI00187D88C5|nr:guanine deaminase [Bradysia coprophila]XP_037028425.1 guanine deaminase [Bradysia coprophila]XP_037028426.1 guanine deaminase [Bradysia coprophila]XP_037028427.1 guanine deaminase [Bradysia coprophila]
MSSTNHVFIGSIIHWTSMDEMVVLTDGFVAVENGKIIQVGKSADLQAWKSTVNTDLPVTELKRHQFLIPGFIDCHIHASQVPNIGLGLNMPLLEWLDAYTFPLESKYGNEAFAADVYEKVVRRTLHSGTTTACYFATNHANGSFVLAQKVLSHGQRAFVGKVSSNCSCPDYYVETTEGSIKGNTEFVDQVLSLNSDLVKPVITPRFAVTCDKELMSELSKLADKHNLLIQTHISENVGEIEFVEQRFQQSYTNVYKSCGLLSSKCILAHAVHLSDDEVSVLSSCNTSIAHCPASNTNLGSGLCDVKRLINAGIKVGLGTDISGGNEVSILNACRDALAVSQHLKIIKTQDIKGTGKMTPSSGVQPYVPLDYKQVTYLATLGGAKALFLDDITGNFEVGKRFDALLIDTASDPIDTFDVNQSETGEAYLLKCLQKFIYCGDDRNIVKVFVDGKQVKHV